MSRVKDAVKRGAELLDKKVPGWYEHIDLEKLDQAFPSSCVVGQLAVTGHILDADNYYTALRRIGVDGSASRFGYDRGVLVTYPELNAEWTRVIRKRRQEPAPAPAPMFTPAQVELLKTLTTRHAEAVHSDLSAVADAARAASVVSLDAVLDAGEKTIEDLAAITKVLDQMTEA